MSFPVLTRTGQLWRKVPTNGPGQLGEAMTMLVPALAFEVVPVSRFDSQQPYTLEATHILWVPRWQELRKEDEVRYGEWTNSLGVTQPFRYVVNGKRQFRTGFRQTAYYCTERE